MRGYDVTCVWVRFDLGVGTIWLGCGYVLTWVWVRVDLGLGTFWLDIGTTWLGTFGSGYVLTWGGYDLTWGGYDLTWGGYVLTWGGYDLTWGGYDLTWVRVGVGTFWPALISLVCPFETYNLNRVERRILKSVSFDTICWHAIINNRTTWSDYGMSIVSEWALRKGRVSR